jgi:peptide/nickel transport system substrate-binding protein
MPYVDKVEVVDRYTVRIHNSQLDVLLPAGLGDVPMYPAKYYQQVGTQGFSTHPVGTGPFKFDRWDKGVQIVLNRYDDYWGKKPQVQRLVFRPFVESATRLAALQTGEIDIAVNAPPDDAQRLKSRGFNIASTAIGQAMILQFNLRINSPLRDRKVRQALNYAIDKEALVKNVMLGFGRVLDGQVVGPDGFGYNPNLKPYSFDLQRAHQLLSEAGFPNGFSIDMDTSQGRYVKQREVSEALVGQLAKASVRVQMHVWEWAEFVTKLDNTLTIAPLAYAGWNYYPAMDADFIFRWYVTDNPEKLFSNPTFDDLYNRQRAEPDRNKRLQLLREMQALLHDEAPMVFLFQSPDIYALKADIQGFRPTPDDRIHFDTVTVSR